MEKVPKRIQKTYNNFDNTFYMTGSSLALKQRS